MSKTFIDGFFETLRDIRAASSPELKKHFDESLERFCQSALGRDLKKANSRVYLSEEEREKLRAQERERQKRYREKMTPEERDKARADNAASMVRTRQKSKKGPSVL